LTSTLRRKPGRFFTLLLLGLLVPVSKSEGRLYVLIDQPSEKGFPIAVVDLLPIGEKKSKGWSHHVGRKIRSDLKLTGLFELIEPEDYPKEPQAFSTDPASVQFGPWSLVGAQGVVLGSYAIDRGSVKVSLALYDPILGQQLVARTYNTRDDEISVVAHHFADEIVLALTGERGIFSTQIAFVCRVGKRKEICLMDIDGDRVKQLTRERSINLSPAWSPSGKRLAYTSYTRQGNPEIFVLEENGSRKQVTSNGTINVSPAWTPAGSLTVAAALVGDTELYLMNSEGEIERRLTNSFGIDINPSWSPDGRSFVFASERAGRLHLFRASADGGALQRLTFVGYHNDNPAWSPRADKIVFQGRDQGHWDLFIMNADGSMIQRLTADQGNNESPTWAPNGRFLAFSSTRNGRSQIYVSREDGTNPIPIGPREGATQPAWSPAYK